MIWFIIKILIAIFAFILSGSCFKDARLPDTLLSNKIMNIFFALIFGAIGLFFVLNAFGIVRLRKHHYHSRGRSTSKSYGIKSNYSNSSNTNTSKEKTISCDEVERAFNSGVSSSYSVSAFSVYYNYCNVNYGYSKNSFIITVYASVHITGQVSSSTVANAINTMIQGGKRNVSRLGCGYRVELQISEN